MNRRKFALAGLALTPVLASVPGVSPVATARRKQARKPGQPKPRNKIVTRTFTNPRWISVPGTGTLGPAFPYPSTIRVNGFSRGRILDVNLTLKGFTHRFPEDVDVMLVAPGGQAAIVMSDVGWEFPVTDLTITLDDQAETPLPRALSLTSGTFQPTNYAIGGTDSFPPPAPQNVTASSLATFKGLNPNGQWRLFVVDDTNVGPGMFMGGWSLTIKARVTNRPRPRRR